MKIFRRVRKRYAILGISCSSNQATSHSGRVLFGFFLYGCLILSHLVYLFRVATGFMDGLECICSLSATSIMFLCFAAIVARKTTLFKCIDEMEKLNNASKPWFQSSI